MPVRRSVLALLAATAGWLGASGVTAQQGTNRLPRHASPALEQAAWYMMRLPKRTDGVALAAQGTQEGHWRFVNRAGEMFTVGTPDEMKRVVTVLYPTAKARARVALYMTEDTIYRHRTTLGSLPADAELNMVVGEGSYRLLRRSGAKGERPLAEIRANLAVEIGDKRLFQETLWQLARPLGRARVLALEPGGPRALAASPAGDTAGKGALVDVIDPASLASAMRSVPGQVLLVVGRAERGLLHVGPSRGPEHILSLADIFRAAGAADVNLIVLQTAATPRQPDGRNRLWSPEPALQQAQLADLLSGLAGPKRRMAVAASAAGRRTLLEVTTDRDLPLPERPARGRLSAIAADITGRAVATGVAANLLSAERQRELDRRFLPGIPAAAQVGYLVLVVLGLVGIPVARAWWARIWPPEAASEYGGRSGYWAACVARGLVFLLVFLPATAVVAGPYSLASRIGGAVRGTGRGWRWVSGRGEPKGETSALDVRAGERQAFDETMPRVVSTPERGRKSGRRARA